MTRFLLSTTVLVLTASLAITTSSFRQPDNNFEKNGLAFYNKIVYDSALINFRQCSDSSTICKYYVAVCNAKLKNYKSAINDYKKLESIKFSNDILRFIDYEVGLCYSHLNKYDSAIFYFQRQVQLSPDYDSYYMIGNSFYFDNSDSSLKYLKMAEQIKPSTLSDTSLNFMLAYVLYDKGSYSESLIYFTKLLDTRPSYSELNCVHYFRGKIFYTLNRMTESLNEFNSAIQLGYKMNKEDLRLKGKIEKKLKK